jgi:hypothetical protein
MGAYHMFRIEHLGFVAVVPCPRCRGEGWLFDDHECGPCSGTGEIVFDAMWMFALVSNLAVGAALCRAFWDGIRRESAYHVDAPWIDRDWFPGCGRSAK